MTFSSKHEKTFLNFLSLFPSTFPPSICPPSHSASLLPVQPTPLSSFHTMPFLSSSDPSWPLPSHFLARNRSRAGDTERKASVERFPGWDPERLWSCINIRGWAHMFGEPFAKSMGYQEVLAVSMSQVPFPLCWAGVGVSYVAANLQGSHWTWTYIPA